MAINILLFLFYFIISTVHTGTAGGNTKQICDVSRYTACSATKTVPKTRLKNNVKYFHFTCYLMVDDVQVQTKEIYGPKFGDASSVCTVHAGGRTATELEDFSRKCLADFSPCEPGRFLTTYSFIYVRTTTLYSLA